MVLKPTRSGRSSRLSVCKPCNSDVLRVGFHPLFDCGGCDPRKHRQRGRLQEPSLYDALRPSKLWCRPWHLGLVRLGLLHLVLAMGLGLLQHALRRLRDPCAEAVLVVLRHHNRFPGACLLLGLRLFSFDEKDHQGRCVKI